MASITRQKERSIPRVQPDGGYLVDSATATLVAYNVHNGEHGWQCDCPAGAQYRACWHVTAVLALEAASMEEADLAADLAAITDYLDGEDEGGDEGGDNPPPGAGATADREATERVTYYGGRPGRRKYQRPAPSTTGGELLYYRDGSPKPYTVEDVRDGSFIRKAQATWSYTDGEVA